MSVINTNISSLIGLNNIRKTESGLQTSLTRLSSGLKINVAADDPSGLAIAKGMEAQIGGINIAIQNAEDGISLIHTADGALAETQDILMRMRDLAVRSSNEATLTVADQQRLDNEFRSLKDELQRKSTAVTFNTKTLFSTYFSGDGAGQIGRMLQVGPDNLDVHQLTIYIPQLGLSGLGLSQTGGNFANITSMAAAKEAISYVQAAIDLTSNVRATLGIQERRINHCIDDLSAESTNISAAKSRIYDADMAAEISGYTKLQILQQTGMAILAQANSQPQNVLQLLK